MLMTLFLLSQVSPIHSSMPPPSSSEGCNDLYQCRRLFDIIFGCLATIFACTWVSVHPNVPPPDQGMVKNLLRRLVMMVAAIIAPEIVVFVAARQFMFAHRFSKEFGVSKTHGFFFAMGGFISHGGFPITTLDQITDGSDAGLTYLQGIRTISESEIKDKSKGDALSKGVALLQVLWFIAQGIGRQIQHLPITTLEISTIAFAVLNIFLWCLWWNKPLSVDVPFTVGPNDIQPTTPTKTDLDERLLYGPISGRYDSYRPERTTSVPMFWSSGDRTDYNYYAIILMAEFFVGLVFGGIHCSGWNTEFPSNLESLLWKFAAAFITAYAAGWGLSVAMGWIMTILAPVT
ncbi:hypothetical protein C8J56DRAFT_169201, partial [Mycena floridula]